ncbi:MAG: hypothetical protein ACKOD0_10140 [Actinomycetota bacterium]
MVHVEDNVGLIQHCKKAYKANGLGEDFVEQFIRGLPRRAPLGRAPRSG